jgi:hypothetical protein
LFRHKNIRHCRQVLNDEKLKKAAFFSLKAKLCETKRAEAKMRALKIVTRARRLQSTIQQRKLLTERGSQRQTKATSEHKATEKQNADTKNDNLSTKTPRESYSSPAKNAPPASLNKIPASHTGKRKVLSDESAQSKKRVVDMVPGSGVAVDNHLSCQSVNDKNKRRKVRTAAIIGVTSGVEAVSKSNSLPSTDKVLRTRRTKNFKEFLEDVQSDDDKDHDRKEDYVADDEQENAAGSAGADEDEDEESKHLFDNTEQWNSRRGEERYDRLSSAACSVYQKYYEDMAMVKTMHQCGFCKHTFPDKQAAEDHVRRYTGQTPMGCLECGQNFHNIDLLNYHKVRDHNDGSSVSSCMTCCVRFKSKSSLLDHLAKFHTLSKGLSLMQLYLDSLGSDKCEICNVSIPAEPLLLKAHYSSAHSMVSFRCADCTAMFKRRYMIPLHRWLDHDEMNKILVNGSTKTQIQVLLNEEKAILSATHKLQESCQILVSFKCSVCDRTLHDVHEAVLKHVLSHLLAQAVGGFPTVAQSSAGMRIIVAPPSSTSTSAPASAPSLCGTKDMQFKPQAVGSGGQKLVTTNPQTQHSSSAFTAGAAAVTGTVVCSQSTAESQAATAVMVTANTATAGLSSAAISQIPTNAALIPASQISSTETATTTKTSTVELTTTNSKMDSSGAFPSYTEAYQMYRDTYKKCVSASLPSCDFCHHPFPDAARRDVHVSHYAGQQQAVCGVCDGRFHNMDLLNLHTVEEHTHWSSRSPCFTCKNVRILRVRLIFTLFFLYSISLS